MLHAILARMTFEPYLNSCKFHPLPKKIQKPKPNQPIAPTYDRRCGRIWMMPSIVATSICVSVPTPQSPAHAFSWSWTTRRRRLGPISAWPATTMRTTIPLSATWACAPRRCPNRSTLVVAARRCSRLWVYGAEIPAYLVFNWRTSRWFHIFCSRAQVFQLRPQYQAADQQLGALTLKYCTKKQKII